MGNKYTTTTHRNSKDEPLYIAILTGSLNYRAKTKGNPVLNQLGDSTVLEHQLKSIRHCYPKSLLSITIGFEADKIIRLRPEASLIENQLYSEFSVVEEIRLLLNSINPSRLVLIDGGIVFEDSVLRDITSTTSAVYVYHSDDVNEVGVQVENGEVVNFCYGLNDKWGNIVYLEGKVLEVFKKLANRNNNKLLLHEILNKVIECKQVLKAIISNKSKVIRII